MLYQTLNFCIFLYMCLFYNNLFYRRMFHNVDVQFQTNSNSKQSSDVSSTNNMLVPPMFLAPPNPVLNQQQPQQHETATSLPNELSNQVNTNLMTP